LLTPISKSTTRAWSTCTNGSVLYLVGVPDAILFAHRRPQGVYD
jgi:hypothetical protein